MYNDINALRIYSTNALILMYTTYSTYTPYNPNTQCMEHFQNKNN